MLDILRAKSFEIIDFDGPIFDTYTVKNAPKYFDAGSTAPFDRTKDLVSAEAVSHINQAVRKGIYPIFNTAALGTTFRGNPLPFTKSWGDPNSDTYLQHLREFQKKGYDAKRRQFESLMSRLAPDVRAQLSAEKNLIVTQPSAGEDKIMTTQGFFNKHNMVMDDWVKQNTTVFDDEQSNLDKFAAAGFMNTRLTLPANFAKMPFAKDRGAPWPGILHNFITDSQGKTFYVNRGNKYLPTYASPAHGWKGPRILSTPHWGTYPTVLLSPSTVQSLDYAKHQHNPAAISDYTMKLLGIPGHGVDETSNAASEFGVMAEDRLNAALTQTSNTDDFYKFITSEDFKVPFNGGTRAIIPNWSKQQVEAIIPFLSRAQQQRVMGSSINIDGQDVWLTGKPDYYKYIPPDKQNPKGKVIITDAKTSGIYGKAKTDEQMRMDYHPQMSAYTWMAQKELEARGLSDVPIYAGFLKMPVNGNSIDEIRWVPNSIDKNGNPIPENIPKHETYLKSKFSQYFRNLKVMGVLDQYAKKNAGQRLRVTTPVFNNEIADIASLTEGTAALDVADVTPTIENGNNPTLPATSIDEQIAADKRIGLRDVPSPGEETRLYELNSLKQSFVRLQDTLNNYVMHRAGKYVNRDVLRSMYKEDPTGESAAWYISEQIGEKKGPYEKAPDGTQHLKKSVSRVIDDFQIEESVREEEKRQKETERLEKKLEKENFARAERNATISARRRFNVASRIADLDTMPLFQFQRDRLAQQYASINTDSNVDDPTDAQRFASALRDVNKALQAAERNTKAWTGVLNTVAHTINQPWYNGEQLANTASQGLSQMNTSASGIIPRRLRGVTGHTTAIGQDIAKLWWDENYNLKYKAVETARPVYTGVASSAGMVIGGVVGGPIGAMIGGAAGVGLAGIPSAISQVKGNIAERNLKVAIGHADIALNIMSIFGELAKNILAIPLKVFTNAIKVTAGSLTASAILIDRFMKQGLDSLQSLGNPIRGLSGVKGYRQYQGLGFADTFLGHQKGTTNAGLEAFGAAQAKLYSMGELDETRVIAAAQLGVFNDVYGNHEDPEKAYSHMVNKLVKDFGRADARGKKKLLALAGEIDSNLPQTLQVMSDMGITNFDSLKQPPGVYWRGIGDGERGAMRWTNAQWQATKEMFGITKMRLATTVWNRVGRDFYNGVSKTGDLIAQGHWKDWESLDENGNVVKHKGAINTALGTFRELIDDIKAWWNTSELSEAIVEFIQSAVDSVKDWLKGLDVSGLAATIGSKLSELFGKIDWQNISNGPLGAVAGVIENLGKMLINTFINVFNTLRGMKFDLKEFIFSNGKKGITFGAGELTNEALIEHLPDQWKPNITTDDFGRKQHYLQGLTSQTDLGTEFSVALEGKTSVLGLMRRFAGKATEIIGTDPSGRDITLGEYLAFLLDKTKELKGKFEPSLEWHAVWQGTTGTQWGDASWLGTGISDFTGRTPAVTQLNEYAGNAVSQVVKNLGGESVKDLLHNVAGDMKDGVLKIKMYIIGQDGREQEVVLSNLSEQGKEYTAAVRLFSQQLTGGR